MKKFIIVLMLGIVIGCSFLQREPKQSPKLHVLESKLYSPQSSHQVNPPWHSDTLKPYFPNRTYHTYYVVSAASKVDGVYWDLIVYRSSIPNRPVGDNTVYIGFKISVRGLLDDYNEPRTNFQEVLSRKRGMYKVYTWWYNPKKSWVGDAHFSESIYLLGNPLKSETVPSGPLDAFTPMYLSNKDICNKYVTSRVGATIVGRHIIAQSILKHAVTPDTTEVHMSIVYTYNNPGGGEGITFNIEGLYDIIQEWEADAKRKGMPFVPTLSREDLETALSDQETYYVHSRWPNDAP